MADVAGDGQPKRGRSASNMRAFTCKDCRREIVKLEKRIAELEKRQAAPAEVQKLRAKLERLLQQATYNESWARKHVERGGSRSDRCGDHRQAHRVNIQGLAVAYIDLKTVGEVADRQNPTGPLGGLGPLPDAHEVVENTSYDLEEVRVGMTDRHVLKMIDCLRQKQVLILKAGTGTGKSTFAPYRLMDPPPESLSDVPKGAPFAKLTDLGPIIVTEPRVQAAVGVASFVGGVMSGAGGVGPGFPVGYQVSGDRNHDEACELIYVTDGTMINWLREGRLSRIGTVIVDEAHERSTNIDFIMGYMKRELPRYPHLRIIVTSATFNTDFYLEYFGGPEQVNVMEVPPEKAFGYGMPFFPNLDTPEDGEEDVLERWTDESLPLCGQSPRNEESFIETHWKSQFAEPLQFPADTKYEDDPDDPEDVWTTTRTLMGLRFDGKIPEADWKERMPAEMAKFVIALALGLDKAGIFGDILGFLPTRRTIEPVCEEIEKALGRKYKDQVFPLISTLRKDKQKKALAKRKKGDPRKIVISTNLAETSLTVEGVRFVVDSGIIAQSEWDPELAQGRIPTKSHSQAGIRQRWGRVGRKAPGWVFPLYTKGQFLALAEDTPPGSTRDNLEALVMTAKMGGIDDVRGFDWPAAFLPTTVELDDKARNAREVFIKELERADRALRAGGAVDSDGHPTSFGKELTRFQGLGSTSSALAILYADRLACVPEVATIIALLDDSRLIGQRGLLLDDRDWPDDWRLEAAERHRGFASLAADDAEVVLTIAAAWEAADPKSAPWKDSTLRQDWCRKWWVNHSVLLESAQKRRDMLSALSPAMKEEVKRFLEPALIDRARGVITRAMAANIYASDGEGQFRPVSVAGEPEPTDSPTEDPEAAEGQRPPTRPARTFTLEQDTLIKPSTPYVVALRRREWKDDNRISSLVTAPAWAMTEEGEKQGSSAVDAMRMVIAASKFSRPDSSKDAVLPYLANWPVGQRVHLEIGQAAGPIRVSPDADPIAPFPRPKNREELGATGQGRGKKRGRQRNRLTIDAEDTEGTREDTRTELRLDSRKGVDDERREERLFAEAERQGEIALGCGQCFPCLDDRPEDCEKAGRATEPGKREDLVAAWRRQAMSGATDVASPRVIIDRSQPIDSDGWYEVTGYDVDDEGYVVKLRPDWRRGGQVNAGQHPDLEAGVPVDVRIGATLTHHGGVLRAFDRLDGKGRFILSEATARRDVDQVKRREIAVSLERGQRGQLKELVSGVVTATVVPGRAEGTLTITLLELLHQHWDHVQLGRGASMKPVGASRRDQFPKKLYCAVIETPPNANGYVTARLLGQDSSLGITHRFDFKTHPTDDRSDSDDGNPPTPDDPVDGDAGRPSTLGEGDAVLLNLRSDRAQLDVSGLNVDELLRIEATQIGQVTIDGLRHLDDHQRLGRGGKRTSSSGRPRPNETDEAELSTGDTGDEEEADEAVAPAGTTIRAKTDRPLSRSAAAALVELSDEDNWANEVWSFWARTHHLQVDDKIPYLPGTEKEPVESTVKVVVNLLDPLQEQIERVGAFARLHPVGSEIECVVKALARDRAFVQLDDDIEGVVDVAELSWANRIHTADQVVNINDRVRAIILEIPKPPGKPVLSIKAMQPDPYEGFKTKCPIGSRIGGRVERTTPDIVYLSLGDSVDGGVHVSELEHAHVETADDYAPVGSTMECEVVGFDDKARRVKLSRKKLLPSPYDEYKGRHQVGARFRATVERVSDSHVNVRHSSGVPGVAHVSQVTGSSGRELKEVYRVGEEILAKITSFNDAKGQVELSIKGLKYDEYKALHSEGETVVARVHRTTRTHAYVIIPGGVPGAVFARNLMHGDVPDVSAVIKVGDVVKALVIGFNDEHVQVELNAKVLLPEPYPAFKGSAPIGTPVAGKINGFNQHFAYVSLPGGVEGSIHVAQISNAPVGRPEDMLVKGQAVNPTVIGFDDARKKVQLSLRQAPSFTPRPAIPAARPTPPARPAPAPVRPVARPQPRSIVVEGETVEIAYANGCRRLGVMRVQATYEVLDPGGPKKLLRAAKPARVRVTTSS